MRVIECRSLRAKLSILNSRNKRPKLESLRRFGRRRQAARRLTLRCIKLVVIEVITEEYRISVIDLVVDSEIESILANYTVCN